MTDTNSTTISCIIKKIIYENSDNNYIVAATEQNTRICGKYFDATPSLLVDEEVILHGTWSTHKKYGPQFDFDTLEIKQNELFFFLTKIIKGMTKATVKSILKKYPEDKLIEILDTNPTKLLEFKGIKQKKLDSIISHWKQFKHLREIGTFLAKFNITTKTITKIYEEFATVENIAQKLEQNPYILTRVKGIGFRRADEIAMAIGIDPRSQIRIMACLKYNLNDYCENNGNSSISKENLMQIATKALGFCDNAMFENAIFQMVANNDLMQTYQNRYAPKYLYHCESFILNFFAKKMGQKSSKKIVEKLDVFLESKKQSFGFELSEEQKYGVQLINEGAKSLVLIGYAGTGKTTSSKAILELLSQIFMEKEIICMALSGIAAQRISDSTGFAGATIQSVLVANEGKEQFEYKAILIDEASMINSVIFYQLVSKINDDAIIIIVGDDGQLPPIGAGDVFANIIKYELAPISKLTKIYRQNEKQAIAVIANDIRQAKIPEISASFEDFDFVDVSIDNYYSLKNSVPQSQFANIRFENSQNILHTIINIASNYLVESINLINAKQIGKFLTLFQVITPMKGGLLGVENLNNQLKKLFNPAPKFTYKNDKFELSIADKVIHIKNENMKVQTLEAYKGKSDEFYEKRVFNGMLGIVIKIDFEEQQAVVLYPNDELIVFYNLDDTPMLLNLAYCLTIHKTQGMEYETVAIVMSFSHYIMHNTKLLYTAITRAKRMCFVIGEKEAFENACKKIDTTIRESVIDDLIKSSLDSKII